EHSDVSRRGRWFDPIRPHDAKSSNEKLGLYLFMDKKHHLYILQSARDGTYYVGSTSNLEDRITRHNGGRSKYTKNRIPWKLVYTEEFSSKLEANHRELEIKKWKSRKMIEKLIGGVSRDI
ncbi:MAG TPA: GIY-YIG nuclease family protein, partial [Ignavibacteria bacterium]|nr:GIY-YIG nuclease family protein [Ignavibacteria bacterium]